MGDHIEEGSRVRWSWGKGTAEGTVVTRYTRRTTLTIKGTEVTRDASADEPAYRIEQDDSDEVLKSHTEIEEA